MAAIPPGFDSRLPHVSDSALEPTGGTMSSSHHGGSVGHLPAKQEELELVSRLELTGAFGDVQPGQLADVAVHKGYAYLNSWDNPDCERGGTYVVDIGNPAAPREAGFIPAQFPYYHGEGAHVVSINTPGFQGDVLAVNNETYGSNVGLNDDCGLSEPPVTAFGGFDLYNVTDPENPVPLVVAAGDQLSVDHDGDPETAPLDGPSSYHSVFVWQDGPRAFLVASDNIEETDVDIFDITNPAVPVQVGDFDLDQRFPQILNGENTRDETFLHHDMVVKHIGGRPVLMSDYWDAGYVQMDVTDPSNPTLITDTTFAGEDPLLPGSGFGPEGNAHQGEFSFDNQFLLAADEDFGPYRLSEKIDGQEVDPQFGFGVPVFADNSPVPGTQIEPGDPLDGGTRFIGLGCDPMAIPPPTATATIAVAERGTCGFEVKAQNAQDAGYEGFVIFNNSAAGTGCETLLNMLFADNTTVSIKGIFVARTVGFRILGVDDPAYTCTVGGATTPVPTAVGDEGEDIALAAAFDGWGYAHLYDAQNSAHLDAFAIPEGMDERYAEDFGVLSIHEFAADPTENLAYSAYYSGGMRVFQFDRANGLRQVGAFIAPEGNDFWGVEQFTTSQGERLIAGSDRDFGLYLFRYTGPGAAQKPGCSDQTVLVPFKNSADVPLSCSDANGNPLRQTRLSDPAGGTIADRAGGGWTYTHTGDRIGPAGSFTFKANDGAADSNTATASLVAVPANGGRCSNRFVGSSARDRIVGSRFGDRINGAQGGDRIAARAGADCVSGNRGGDRLAGEGGRDRVSGNSGNDRLLGGPGPDLLFGGSGRDLLSAGGGRNRLFGGAGNDGIRARNDRVDRIRCGAGNDRVTADKNDRVARDCERVRRG